MFGGSHFQSIFVRNTKKTFMSQDHLRTIGVMSQDVEMKNGSLNSVSSTSSRAKRRGSFDTLNNEEGHMRRTIKHLQRSRQTSGLNETLAGGPLQYVQEYMGTLSSQHPNTLQNLNTEFRESRVNQREEQKGVRIVNPTKEKVLSFINQFPRVTCVHLVINVSKFAQGSYDNDTNIDAGILLIAGNLLDTLRVLSSECPDLVSLHFTVENCQATLPASSKKHWKFLVQHSYKLTLWDRLIHLGFAISVLFDYEQRETVILQYFLLYCHNIVSVNVRGFIFPATSFDFRTNLTLLLPALESLVTGRLFCNILDLPSSLRVLWVINLRCNSVIFSGNDLTTVFVASSVKWFDSLTSLRLPQCRYLFLTYDEDVRQPTFDGPSIVDRCSKWIRLATGNHLNNLELLGFDMVSSDVSGTNVLTKAILSRAMVSNKLQHLYVVLDPRVVGQLSLIQVYVNFLHKATDRGKILRTSVNPQLQSITLDFHRITKHFKGKLRNSYNQNHFDFQDLDFKPNDIATEFQRQLRAIEQTVSLLGIRLYISPYFRMPKGIQYPIYNMAPEFYAYVKQFSSQDQEVCNIH